MNEVWFNLIFALLVGALLGPFHALTKSTWKAGLLAGLSAIVIMGILVALNIISYPPA